VFLAAGVDGWGELAGRLDPAGFQVLTAALDAATVAEGEGEPARTRSQQRGDAVVAMARAYLDHTATTATTRRSRPDVTVVVTLDELERRAGRSVDGEPLDPATVGSLLCDAGVHRVVTDGASVVLDAGRTTRTVGHHLFRGLAVRDGGCRFPGCDLAVSRCEAHHVTPWQHGGATDQSNVVLLCWRHHHDFAHHPSGT
jgi:5-methylcytosine-specific restriction protein A